MGLLSLHGHLGQGGLGVAVEKGVGNQVSDQAPVSWRPPGLETLPTDSLPQWRPASLEQLVPRVRKVVPKPNRTQDPPEFSFVVVVFGVEIKWKRRTSL